MGYKIIPSDLASDREAVIALWSRNLPNATEKRYRWLYEKGKGRIWLVAAEDGERVGSSGLMERKLLVFGESRPAGEAVDLNVDADHRTIGPALSLQRAVVENVDNGRLDLIYAVAVAGAELVERRVGYQVLGVLERWVRPLRLGAGLRGRLQKPWLQSRFLKLLLDPVLAVRSWFPMARLPAGARIEILDSFDERFDALWERARDSDCIMGERTASYLNWRFGESPNFQHRAYCLFDRNDALLAYLVYTNRNGLVYVGDFYGAELRQLAILLARFSRLMRKEGAEALVVTFLGAEAIRKRLGRSGFWPLQLDQKVLVYAKPEGMGEKLEALRDPKRWYLTQADIGTDF